MTEHPECKYKMAIVIRQDLKMGKGKICAQVGHASVSASETARKERKAWWKRWIEEGQCKVVLKVSSEDELLKLESKARSLGLPTTMVRDRGLTQLRPNTLTCIAIGPGPIKTVDTVTGQLRLL
ncbi:MAG: peptidyl-tRNA hydrolase Pth2 [Candidatus Bathyarchaeia archaeon]